MLAGGAGCVLGGAAGHQALWGAAVTLALNFWWIPLIGYMGSAWATLVCYASMAWLSYLLGQKYYRIPYDLKRLIGYPVLATGLVLAGQWIEGYGFWQELALKNLAVVAFVALILAFERAGWRKSTISIG